MAAFLVSEPNGARRDVDVGPTLHIGSAEGNDLCIDDAELEPRHALVSRSARFQVPVLVDLTRDGGRVEVNGRRVVLLRVLRHRDVVQLGRARLAFSEMTLRRAETSAKCPVCAGVVSPGMEIVSCPRCRMPHHKSCWFLLKICSTDGCAYPVQDTMCRLLSGQMRFARLEESDQIIKDGRRCAAGTRRDRRAFRANDRVGYCPGCQSPYHAECWFALERCPRCAYHVRETIDELFALERTMLGRLIAEAP